MIATIAVGTDGSDTAGRAVDAALTLAERFGAEVVLLSAYTSRGRGGAGPRLGGGSSFDAEWASNDAEQVERILAVAEESATQRGIRCSTAMGEGDPGEVLVNLADRHGVDVLVVGSRGMERRILGSVPNTVTHKAPCSVLLVKTT
jgi:nucleotide-binding universal stress UspA family protein